MPYILCYDKYGMRHCKQYFSATLVNIDVIFPKYPHSSVACLTGGLMSYLSSLLCVQVKRITR